MRTKSALLADAESLKQAMSAIEDPTLRAVIGGILGGSKGAAQVAAIGGAVGGGAVLATRGKEVELASGSALTAVLASPLTLTIDD